MHKILLTYFLLDEDRLLPKTAYIISKVNESNKQRKCKSSF